MAGMPRPKPSLLRLTASALFSLALPLVQAMAQTPATTELNLANQAELEQVPGLGPQLAERLLHARRAGLFISWADAQQRVKGLGPASAKRLSERGLRINGQAWAAATPLPKP
jgi:competence protein ComEA